MKNEVIQLRNSILALPYKYLIKPILFKMDPEKVHDAASAMGEFFGANPALRAITAFFYGYRDPALKQNIFGIEFENPVGLAAGFDKNALLTGILPDVGFGFEEVGSITGEACAGNPKPRLWRLPKSKGLVVYYGLKNDGAAIIAKRLRSKKFRIPIGISIAKTNSKKTVTEKSAIADYVKAYKAFEKIGDYYAINISCPNAFGGEPFSSPAKLDKLLGAIYKNKPNKPIFLKLAPALPHATIDGIIKVARKYKVDGFICSNLSKNRKSRLIKDKNLPEHGSISGKVAFKPSNDDIEYIYKKTSRSGPSGRSKSQFVIIGVGGIFSAEDAYAKIRKGASLVQLITGMVFEGPQLISEINRGLCELLRRDGFKNISEAVGADYKK